MEVVRLLGGLGANLKAATTYYRETPSLVASKSNHMDVVRVLEELGENPAWAQKKAGALTRMRTFGLGLD